MASQRGAEEYATTVVRLFPDHARSVLWFSGPVPYEATQLDERLVADLRAWEISFYAGRTRDLAWSSPRLAVQFDVTGVRLARRLADAIGDDFEVEYFAGESRRRVRGAGPALNPAAAAMFQRWADQSRKSGSTVW